MEVDGRVEQEAPRLYRVHPRLIGGIGIHQVHVSSWDKEHGGMEKKGKGPMMALGLEPLGNRDPLI